MRIYSMVRGVRVGPVSDVLITFRFKVLAFKRSGLPSTGDALQVKSFERETAATGKCVQKP